MGKAERGAKEPSLYVLLKLATVFEVSPAYLLTPPRTEGSNLDEIVNILASRSPVEVAWVKEMLLFMTRSSHMVLANSGAKDLPTKYGRPEHGRPRGKKRTRNS